MNDNQFLEQYKKKLEKESVIPAAAPDPAGTPVAAPTAGKHYEQHTDFVPPRPVVVVAPDTKQRGRRFLPIIIAAILVLALAITLVWYTGRGVRLIDLTGYTLSEAQIWAGERNIRLQITRQFNDEHAENVVFDQVPAAGSALERGGFLRLMISQGHDLTITLPLPDLLSMTMAEVEAWAAENFMNRVRITTEYSNSIPSGRVIRFEVNDPTVVEVVRRNSPVYVIVSRGPEPQSTEPVTVPDYTQMTRVQALQHADDNNLILVIVEEYHDQLPKDAIFEQSIASNQTVETGSSITLKVSLGRKVIIPDLSGLSRERASSLAAELGIPIQISERYSSRAEGNFISQNITAGSVFKAGDILEIAYSLGNQINAPGFAGQPLSSIQAWAGQHNRQGASLHISVTRTENNAPKDTIIFQDKANASVAIDATIRVTVSLGRKVFVPDLVAPAGSGYDQAVLRGDATRICDSLGLIVIFVPEKKEGRLPGEIWHQSAAPGSELFDGSTITLKYNPVNMTLDMPDFTGKTVEQIKTEGWLTKLRIT